MGLSALVDGELVTSVLLEPDEWEQLVTDSRAGRRTLTMRCGARAHGRVSVRGTPHFVHARGENDGCSAGESIEHVYAKGIIAVAAAAAGWTVLAEAPIEGPNGRSVADVLVERDGVRVVFEVQLSRQHVDDYRRRTARLRAAGIASVAWFAKHLHGLPLGSRDLPVFPTKLPADERPHVIVNGRHLDLGDVVQRLLTKRLQHRDRYLAPVTIGSTVVASMGCHACGERTMVWQSLGEQAMSPCGRDLGRTRVAPHFAWARPEELRHIADPARQHAAKLGIRPARIRNRDSYGRSYAAFTCPSCSATFDDRVVESAIRSHPLATLERRDAGAVLAIAHWCLADDHGRCC